jgi:uncharacterized protein YheU (UPF0270 family)
MACGSGGGYDGAVPRSTTPPPVTVPLDRLDPDTLRRLAEAFVTRDGTDYGATEPSLDAKVDDVLRQLRRGEAAVVYDPESETVTIVRCETLR